ncbi:ABC transporter ATP-binding protein [Falcatimonas sp. MSJ-15]|uniref:ABC transporter ATP-binding protein n=1 Tax=Falcatimonas sp. MSJ-15 TaxID=2841515 RepID=UPI002738E5BA|nr:oligopeptide/dipeptide ABC transporter ATP-binding protein [Falcatimonas sp. MSJ-15]
MEKRELLLDVVDLKKYYPVNKTIIKEKRKYLKAVDGINLRIYKGETVGLVGESGCGKSTLGRTILKLHQLTDGAIWYKGNQIESYGFEDMRELRKDMQMIFQDPFASLNPRMTIFDAVKAPLDVFKIGTNEERTDRVKKLLNYVGLGENHIYKYPHEMSGGQRQRVVIARAVISNPEFIVCDEPVSALDVSVRSQVLNLMKDMQENMQLSYLFISHDLSVVRYLCDRIAVMYLGRIVEIASKKELFENPIHPYTKALISAIPIPDVKVKTKRIILKGDVPSPIDPPTGCRFHTRCPYATKECAEVMPELKEINSQHQVACIHAI